MSVSGKWKLGQRVQFTEVLTRSNEVEYEDKPAPTPGYSDDVLDFRPLRYRRGRVYNRWHRRDYRHYEFRPLRSQTPAEGILVRITSRRDTEVCRGYEGEGNYGVVIQHHRVALVAVGLRVPLVVVPLENLRPVEEDSEVLAKQVEP